MATADERTLKILIQTRAELAGIDATKGSLQDLAKISASVNDQLAAAGAKFDPVSKTFKSITTESQAAAGATQSIGLAGIFAGAQLNKARGEATVLAREIVTGSVNARTIGALLGSLGNYFTIGAIAAFGLFKVLEDIVSYSGKLNAEIDKISEGFDKHVSDWLAAGRLLTDQSGLFKLGDVIAKQLAEADQKSTEFQEKALGGWHAFAESVSKLFVMTPQGGSVLGFSKELDEAKAADRVEQLRRIRDALDLYNVSKQTEEVWARIRAEPFAQGLKDADAEIEKIKSDMSELLKSLSVNPSASGVLQFMQLGMQLEVAKGQLDGLVTKQQQASQEAARLGAEWQKVNLTPLDPGDRVKVLSKDLSDANLQLERLGYTSVTAAIAGLALINTETKEGAASFKALADAIRQVIQLTGEHNAAEKAETRAGERDIQKDITAFLREESRLLEQIHGRQQVIAQNPFLSADQREALSLPLIINEIDQLQSKIRAGEALMRGGTLDPAKYDEVAKAVDQLKTKVTLLGFQMQTLSFGGGLRESMVQWANSFGSTAQQVGRSIQESIGASLQSLNDLLVQGKFNAVTLVQSLAGIALQLLEHLAIQELMAAFGLTAAAQTAAQGPVVAAAWAPAAAATSIGSFGASATTGGTLAIAEIGAIIGALAVAHEGGVVGDLPAWSGGPLGYDERLVVTKLGETILPTHLGSMQISIPRMHTGGVVGGGSISGRPQVHIGIYDDPQKIGKWLQSARGEKHLIDLINRRRFQIGIPT